MTMQAHVVDSGEECGKQKTPDVASCREVEGLVLGGFGGGIY